jgi:hypothetical protein
MIMNLIYKLNLCFIIAITDCIAHENQNLSQNRILSHIHILLSRRRERAGVRVGSISNKMIILNPSPCLSPLDQGSRDYLLSMYG